MRQTYPPINARLPAGQPYRELLQGEAVTSTLPVPPTDVRLFVDRLGA